MADEIFFDGVRYISAGEAASLGNLTRDYIARLCKDGKILGKRVGKQWYVSSDSLQTFVLEQEHARLKRQENLANERKQEYERQNGPSVKPPHVPRSIFAAASAPVFKAPEPVSKPVVVPVRTYAHEALLRASAHGRTHIARAAHAASKMSLATPLSLPHAVPAGIEFLHKLSAFVVAALFILGTYAFVDAEYARVVTRAPNTTMKVASFAQAQLAAVAENPTGALENMFANLARTLNTRVNTLVYNIMFPDSLIFANNKFAGTISSQGSVVAKIVPRASQSGSTAANSKGPAPAGNVTIVNQPVVERIIERVTSGALASAGGISEDILNRRLEELENELTSHIYSVSSQSSSNATNITNIYQEVAHTQRIDQLDSVAITNSSWTGGTISGVDLNAGDLVGVVAIENGGTATSTAPSYGQLLIGNAAGGYDLVATSSLGYASASLITAAFPFTTTTFGGTTANATSTLIGFNAGLYSLASSTIGDGSQAGGLSISGGATTTGNVVVQGTGSSTFAGNLSIAGNINFNGVILQNDAPLISSQWTTNVNDIYYSTGHVGIGTSTPWRALSVVGSSDLGNSALAGYFTATTSTASQFPYASSTAISVSGTGFFDTASTTNLTISSIASGSLLKTTTAGVVTAAIAGTDYATIAQVSSAYPFALAGNATSTLTQFNGGLTAFASSTIGNGTQTGGLTVSGGATTTGDAYVGGNIYLGGYDALETLYAEKSINNSRGVRYTLKNTNTSGQSYSGAILYANGTTVASQFYADGLGTGPLGTPGFYVGNFSNHPVGFFTNNTEKARLSASGNFGIGTTSPWRTLSVHGSSDLGTNALAGYFTATTTTASVFPNASTTALSAYTAAFGGTATSTFTSAGYLGVGTTSPWALISINPVVGDNTAPAFAIGSSTKTNFVVTNAGNVGVGVTAPSTLLSLSASVGSTITINSTSNNSYSAINFRESTTDKAYIEFTNSNFATVNRRNALEFINIAAGPITFYTNNTEKIRIDADGNLGLGTTTPGSLLSLQGVGNLAAGTSTLYAALTSLYFNATSTTVASQFPYASSTAISATTASTTNLIIGGVTSSLLKTSATGAVTAALAGTDYATISQVSAAYPFALAGNATSTLTQFNGGLTAFASSTIGAGGQTTGLTISGGATTTGNQYIGGSLGIANQAPSYPLDVAGSARVVGTLRISHVATSDRLNISTSGSTNFFDGPNAQAFAWRIGSLGTTEAMRLTSDGLLGLGTTSPYAKLSVEGSSALGNSALAGYFIATTTTASQFPYASSTMISATTASTTNLTISGISSGSLLKTTTAGSVIAAIAGTDYATISQVSAAYPFALTGNATSTLTQFNGGLTAFASSTIGNGTATGGLTVNGSATTTGTTTLISTGSYALDVRGRAVVGDTSNLTNVSAATILSVLGNSASRIEQRIINTSTGGAVIRFFVNGGEVGLLGVSSAAMEFDAGGSTRLNINASTGNLMVGNGTGAATNGRLQVRGSTTDSSANALYLENSAGGALAVFRNDGNFGIGTTSPWRTLSVHGSSDLGTNALAGYFTATTTTASVFPNASTTALSAYTAAFGGTATSTFGTNGYLGLGTSTPWAKLSINPVVGDTTAPAFAIGSSSATTFVVTNAGNVGIGTASPTNRFDLVTNTLDSGQNAMALTTTLSATAASQTGVSWSITSGGSSGTDTQTGFGVNFNAGYTGSGLTTGAAFTNLVAGGGSDFTSTAAYNAGLFGQARGTTAGDNIGVQGIARGGNISIGLSGKSVIAKSGAINIGNASYAANTSGTAIGGYFFVGSTKPLIASTTAALVANNTSTAAPIFVGYDNDAEIFRIDDGGNVGIGTTSPWRKLSVNGSSDLGTNALAGYFTATTSTASSFPYASSTAISVSGTGFFDTASTTNLTISSIASGSLLKTTTAGQVTAAIAGTDYATIAQVSAAYPFALTGNATSTLTQFNGGLTAFASSTIGAGGQTTGLTIFGGATTTGNAYVAGNVGVGTVSPGSKLDVLSTAGAQLRLSYSPTVYSTLQVASDGQLTFTSVGSNASVLYNSDFYVSSAKTLWAFDGSNSYIGLQSTGGINKLKTDASGTNKDISIAPGNVVSATFANSGNLGLGTTTPWRKLSVNGSSDLGTNALAGYFIATTSTASLFPYASTTMITATTASSTNLIVSSAGGTAGCATFSTNGTISNTGVACGSGSGGAAYPFALTGNATSTLTQFNGGLTAFASSTIGNGNQNGGLTISGGATTTGNAYFAGNIGIQTSNPNLALTIGTFGSGFGTDQGGNIELHSYGGSIPYIDFAKDSNDFDFREIFSPDSNSLTFSASSTPYLLTLKGNGNVGLGTTSPYARLSVEGSSALGNSALAGYFIATTSTASLFPYASTTMITATTASSTNLIVSSAGGTAGCATFSTNGTISNTGVACGSGGTGGQLVAVYATSTVGTTTVNFAGTPGAAPSFSGSTLSLPSNTVYYVVQLWGAGGGGGGGGVGGTGGTGAKSCFGNNSIACVSSLMTANGGTGGAANAGAGGTGGTATGGDVNMTGGGGIAGDYNSANGGAGASAPGGGGAGGQFGVGVSTAGGAGNAFGGGGGGGGSNTFGGSGGGSGGYAQKLITDTTVSYFTIGAGGTAGSAGSAAGGAGGTGGLVITVYVSGSVASGTVASSTQGYVAYYGANGSTLTGTSSIYIGTTGQVGIGTTTPWAKLSVVGSSDLGNSALAGYFTATTTTASQFPYASSTAISVSGTGFFDTASTTNLTISSIASGSLLKTTTAGSVIAAVAGTDYATISQVSAAYPFALAGNATSTLTQFNGGLTAFASSTIGNGTQTGGLTISGGATTTGNAYFTGNVNLSQYSAYQQNGNNILYASTTNHSTAVGVNAGYKLYTDSGANYNTAVGEGALGSNSLSSADRNNAIGAQSFNSLTTGSQNNAFGVGALYTLTDGWNNVALGDSAGYYSQNADANVYIGYQAGQGQSAQSQDNNVGIGYRSLYKISGTSGSNVALGYQAGYGITSGSNNIALGAFGTVDIVTSGSNNILIGQDVQSGITATASNQLNIGNLIFGKTLGSGTTVSTGQVGIGTTTPYSRLTVWGTDTSASTKSFLVANSASTTLFSISNDGTASTTNLIVSSAGGTAGCATFSTIGLLSNTGTACGTGSGSSAGSGDAVFAVYATSTVGTTTVNLNGTAGAAPSFSAGTLTLPSNTSKLVVEVWGAGGGGGGGANGGGGTPGGQTCFGTNATACSSPLVRATGGSQGTGVSDTPDRAGGAGGTGVGGDINITGSGGMGGSGTSAGTNYWAGGIGGSAPRGGGGGNGAPYNAAGNSGNSFGGGGSGGGVNGIASANFSGTGGGGGGYAQKLISSPSGTYTFTVTAGGTGGTAGSGGFAGGAGGTGGVVITVYVSGSVASGTVASSTQGYVAYYGANGSTLTGTSSIYIGTTGLVGIGTTTPYSKLSIWGSDTSASTKSFLVANSASTTLFSIANDGTASTTNLIVSSAGGTAGCATFSTIGLLSNTGTACGSGSASFPFTPTTNFGVNTNATSTALSLLAGFNASSTVRFGNQNGTQFIWDSSLGRLGIGTSTPFATLAIQATTTNQTTPLFEIASTSNATKFVTVTGAGFTGFGTSSPWAQVSINPTSSNNSAPAFAIGSSTATNFVVTNAGTVGVGTSTPWRKLSIVDTVSSAQVAIAYDGVRYAQLQTNSVGDLIVSSSGQDTFWNDDNVFVCTGGSCPSNNPTGTGNVIVENKIGIGTTTPASKLTIETQDSTTDFLQIASTTAQNLFNIKANGSVGIASSSPFARLAVGAGGAIVTTENTLTDSATIGVVWTDGNQQRVVLGGNRTINFTNYIDGQVLRLVVCQDGTGSRTVTWGTTIRWSGGSAPTLTTTASKCDLVTFIATKAEGGTIAIFGAAAANF